MTSDLTELLADDYDNLRHMLGAEPHYSKRNWGFRNHFCACTTGEQWESMMRLESRGYVVRGMEQNTTQFFHATREGCDALGFKPYQIKNALGG